MSPGVVAVAVLISTGAASLATLSVTVMLGAAAPAHVLTPSSTVRRLVNMTALAVDEAQVRRRNR